MINQDDLDYHQRRAADYEKDAAALMAEAAADLSAALSPALSAPDLGQIEFAQAKLSRAAAAAAEARHFGRIYSTLNYFFQGRPS